MRKLLRSMAKAQMKKMGADKINKRMRYNWRRVVGAYPVDTMTSERMKEGYHGRKEYRPGTYMNHLFRYDWKFQPIPGSGTTTPARSGGIRMSSRHIRPT